MHEMHEVYFSGGLDMEDGNDRFAISQGQLNTQKYGHGSIWKVGDFPVKER